MARTTFLSSLPQVGVSNPFNYLHLKRLMDITLSAIALAVLSPLLLTIVALIRRDGGPALFRQTRVGLNGRHFTLFKFRSMVVNAEQLRDQLEEQNEMSGTLFKIKRDPRITPLGRLLRRFSLDELPQLFNVFMGDMSIVGPRPALPREVAAYTPMQRRRLQVKQGLTCFWQVGGRSLLAFEEQVAMDLKYVAKASLITDLVLILRTFPAVLGGKGAY